MSLEDWLHKRVELLEDIGSFKAGSRGFVTADLNIDNWKEDYVLAILFDGSTPFPERFYSFKPNSYGRSKLKVIDNENLES